MRFTSIVALLPALALAQEQVPLADRVQGWFNKAKSFVPSAPQAANAPIEKMAEKVSESHVTTVDMSNWQDLLAPGLTEEDWMVYITGGNKSCFGRCELADKAFQESTLLFAADPTSPHLGFVDCESNSILCSIWSAGAPSIFYFHVPKAPQAGEARPSTPLHIFYLNTTTVTPNEIYQIHGKQLYNEIAPYEGALHPIDGWLAQYKLNIPLGYLIWALGAIPSWMFMIGISFFSRTFMSRRMGNVGAPQQRPTPAGSAN
ncbi:hypothetical protein N7474_001356 [Penicillium riverlandense]|uniref:uncharacterized protein n=1 Tax=Penicillium riverlandense TaxID=1903569 RepID=UPI002549BBCE|nr:uncharacterized protein N7474_001356 [Penicillium riverlandense]KAJ5833045.1 hypothetical protein N7474_001356 [Penicillium riverlandense]